MTEMCLEYISLNSLLYASCAKKELAFGAGHNNSFYYFQKEECYTICRVSHL